MIQSLVNIWQASISIEIKIKDKLPEILCCDCIIRNSFITWWWIVDVPYHKFSFIGDILSSFY